MLCRGGRIKFGLVFAKNLYCPRELLSQVLLAASIDEGVGGSRGPVKFTRKRE